MKARGLILVDYDLPNGFMDAAEEQKRLQNAMEELVRGNNKVTYFQCDIKERRGDQRPDLRKLNPHFLNNLTTKINSPRPTAGAF